MKGRSNQMKIVMNGKGVIKMNKLINGNEEIKNADNFKRIGEHDAFSCSRFLFVTGSSRSLWFFLPFYLSYSDSLSLNISPL